MTVVADRPVSEAARPPAPHQPDRVTDSPATAAGVPADVPRVVGMRSTDSVLSLAGSGLAALSFVWVVYEHVLGWSGALGFVVCTWVVFLAIYAGVTAIDNPAPVIRDRLASAIVHSGAAVIALALGSVVYYAVAKGWPALPHWNFYTQDMSGVRPTDSLDRGGCLHAIVGSGIEIGIATVISLPLGLGTAIYLSESRSRLAAPIRTVVEAMTALPDILAGLFIYTVLIIGFHWEKTGLTVALALSVTMIPIIARSAEVVLRVVPSGLREASLALGASRWQTVRRVVLPTARSGLATSLILGIARIAGETAPLLIVSGASIFLNANPLREPMNSLPMFIFTAVTSGEPNFRTRGYGAAVLLLAIVLTLFLTARFVARDRRPKTRRRTAQPLPTSDIT
jgi:phosphate transport system permease protein